MPSVYESYRKKTKRNTSKDDVVLERAKKNFTLAAAAQEEQRKRDLAARRFVSGDQWADDVKSMRAGTQPTGSPPVPPRPMLTIPMINQPIQLVKNQIKNAHLAFQVHPKDEGASQETAEIVQGKIRDIEMASGLDSVVTWAADSAIETGLGWFRILAEYADDSDDPYAFNDQELVFARVPNQASVYPDPSAERADLSDGEFLFLSSFFTAKKFERKYPEADVQGDALFTTLGDDAPDWMQDIDGERSARVTEYFECRYEKRTRIAYQTPNGELAIAWSEDLPDDFDVELIESARTVEDRTIDWYTINGVEVLEHVALPISRIPLIPAIGIERNINGQKRYVGMVEPMMDPCRLLNYAISAAVEKQALDTKAPWIGTLEQFEGLGQWWNYANVRNFPYIPYKAAVGANGQLLPPPQRNLAGPDLNADIMLIVQAREFIQSTSFVHDPSLGKSSPGESGKKVLALQQQADAGNSNYLDNLITVSYPLAGRILLEWMPHIYDRPGRVINTRGADDEVSQAILNAPYVVDPTTKKPMLAPKDAPNAKLHDLSAGHYNVTISAGKSYQTRLQQGADEIGQILMASPELMPLIGPIYFKFRDFPGHQEIADLLKQLRAKQYPGLAQEGEQADPQQMQAKLQEQGQMIQQLGQQLTQAAQQIQTDWAKAQGDLERSKIDNATKLEIEKLKVDAQLQLEAMKGELERYKANLKVQADAIAREDEQAHEVGMAGATAKEAERQAQQAEESAEREAVRGEVGAERSDSRAAEQSERTADREDVRSEREAARQSTDDPSTN